MPAARTCLTLRQRGAHSVAAARDLACCMHSAGLHVVNRTAGLRLSPPVDTPRSREWPVSSAPTPIPGWSVMVPTDGEAVTTSCPFVPQAGQHSCTTVTPLPPPQQLTPTYNNARVRVRC